MLKQDKVFYSSLIGILLNTVSFLMREHREVFFMPLSEPHFIRFETFLFNPLFGVSGFLRLVILYYYE